MVGGAVVIPGQTTASTLRRTSHGKKAQHTGYGYAILQRVRELSDGNLEWTDGMLYPVLHRLLRLQLVEARWEVAESGRRRKYYRITSLGRAQLAEQHRQWQAVDATLRGIWHAASILVPDGQSHGVGRATTQGSLNYAD